jgi:hypothetical protein
LHVLALLDDAISRIPPPVALAPHVAAWRAFAMAMGGRLELGRVWIHDASLEGFRFEVGTVWEPHDTAPRGTVIRVPIDPPLATAPTPDDAALSAIARDAFRALAEDPGFHASESELGHFTSKLTPDPSVLLPKIESMTVILRALRGVVAAGPFR